LAKNGRAAIVVPEGVLTSGGAGEVIKRRLLQEFDVHTLLRLPTGIFYAQGVNANVLFFDKPSDLPKLSDRKLWVYDLRANMHFTLSGNRIERSDLDGFVQSFLPGNRHSRVASWSPENPLGRWRAYPIQELLSHDKVSLDLSWIDKGERYLAEGPEALESLAANIMQDLKLALEQFSKL